MDWREVVRGIDAETARAFVTAACRVIDAMLLETHRRQAVRTPEPRDYEGAALTRDTDPGGWLAHDELRATAQRLAEAVAAEKWTEGLLAALTALRCVGGMP